MNNFFTQLKNTARTIKLSQSEKQAMRVRLYNHFEQNPMGAFAAPAMPAGRPVPSPFFFFSPRFAVPIALLLVVGLGSGTAFAAQSSLPGNPLYAVKINVNEAVQSALATTPQAKAEVNAELATNRLEEAETLAAQGTLDATTTSLLASNFAAHAQAAQASTHDVGSKDPGAAAQLGAEFSGTLAAHSAILAQIGDSSKSDETMQNSNSLAVAVQQEEDRGNHDDEVNADSGASAVASVTPALAIAPAPSNGARLSAGGQGIRTFAAAMPVASGTATSAASTSPLQKGKGKAPQSKNVATTTSANSTSAKIAVSLGAQASTSLGTTNADFSAIKSSLDSNTSAQITGQISAIQNILASANVELAAGDTSSAIRDFNTVIRMSVKIDAYLKAGKKFSLRLLSTLIGTANAGDYGQSGDTSGGKQGSDSGKGSVTPAPTPTSTPDSNSTDKSSQDSSDTSSDHGKGPDVHGDVQVNLHL